MVHFFLKICLLIERSIWGAWGSTRMYFEVLSRLNRIERLPARTNFETNCALIAHIMDRCEGG